MGGMTGSGVSAEHIFEQITVVSWWRTKGREPAELGGSLSFLDEK